MAHKAVPFSIATQLVSTKVTLTPSIPFPLINEFAHMDVMATVHTIQGSGGVFVFIYEQFPNGDGGSSYIQTMASNALSTAQTYLFSYENNNLAGPYSGGLQQNPFLGKGMAKQIVFSMNNVTGTANVDLTLLFWEG